MEKISDDTKFDLLADDQVRNLVDAVYDLFGRSLVRTEFRDKFLLVLEDLPGFEHPAEHRLLLTKAWRYYCDHR